MTVRYSHLVSEHKAQAVMRLAERFKQNSDSVIVSPELKEAIGEVQPMDLAQNRHIYFERKGRGLKTISKDERLKMARDGIEPPTRGFSDIRAT
jgi:hypothetical protein